MSEKLSQEQYEAIKKTAEEALGKEDFEQAIRIYQEALEKYDNKADFLVDIGNILTDQQKYKEAMPYYLQALELDPSSWRAFHNIARIYSKEGNPLKSIEYLKKALEVKPDSYISWNSLGNDYTDAKLYDRAQAAYDKALSIDSEAYPARYSLGRLFIIQAEWEKALAIFESIEAITPDDLQADLHLMLGAALFQLGNLDRARVSYLKLSELTPSNPYIYEQLAFIYFKNREYENTKLYLEKQIALDPMQQSARENIVRCLHEMQDYEKAKDAAMHGLSLFPNAEFLSNYLKRS